MGLGMESLKGWLMEVYANPAGGLTVWLLGEDGQRYCLKQSFPVTFFAAGPPERLHSLGQFLENQPVPAEMSRQDRTELGASRPTRGLAVRVQHPDEQPRLFARVRRSFPELDYFDADIALPLRYAAVTGLFPLARCALQIDDTGWIREVRALDSPWDLHPAPAPLRVMTMEPDENPSHRLPVELRIRCGRARYRLALTPVRPLLVNLRVILQRHDPDLLLSAWGDTWLLPRLLALSRRWKIPLPFNRDRDQAPLFRRERSYFSYGQVIHRGRQVHLFGRWHVDRCNAMLWDDYQLEGVLELARVTALPLQTAARVSPGSGISAMQMLTALRDGILIPWRKQVAERPKTALQLLRSDQGGLVYQPIPGLHRDVAEIDFISMYPGIMVRFNVSPETAPRVPEAPADGPPGLVPRTLAPLLKKRLALKNELANMPRWHPDYHKDKARAAAHKWLLVTCFGYLGYKNARFGRIEAHEAVTAYGREALLRAKETAEEMGFTVLHLYVDGLWVRKPGLSQPGDFQALLERIVERTGLPIALDGIYRWVAFLSSRVDKRVPVANRYFGVFQDGSMKLRGIEARRKDTPAWVAGLQMELLELLAGAPDADALPGLLPEAVRRLQRALRRLRAGRVPLETLVVRQRLSRELEEYRTPSPAAQAAAQLLEAGKRMRPGQRVRLIYTRGRPGVYAWDLPAALDPARVNTARYTELLLRAASAVLEPVGVKETELRQWVLGGGYLRRLERS